MTYGRQRLWLGITGVGSTVLLCTIVLAFDLPHRLVSTRTDASFGWALAAIALSWMIHAALLTPVDLIGGLVVVREPRRFWSFVASWLRAVAVQWAWFMVAAAVLLRTGQSLGTGWAIGAFLLLQVVLLRGQLPLARLVGGVHVVPTSPALIAAAGAAGIAPGTVREVEGDDIAFVGAWTGALARYLYIPRRWVQSLSADELSYALARRAAARVLGLRQRGVMVALAWNTTGFALSAVAPLADLTTAPGFIAVLAWFTLWSFAGVVVLPSASRPAIYALDRWAQRLRNTDTAARTIRKLDRWQDDEADRDPRVELVFHPVPSLRSRLEALSGLALPTGPEFDKAGAWHATRMMLYLSWAGLGGLARAVHCNVGRPALWVMLPGD